MHHKFRCDSEFISNVCKGRCCEGTKGIMVSILPEEIDYHTSNNNSVIDGMLTPDDATGLCPYKMPNGYCKLHNTIYKPFGCRISPFTLKNDTLIVRHRYVSLPCSNQGQYAYITFRDSIDMLFGKEQADRICEELSTTNEDVYGIMDDSIYQKLIYLDSLKNDT